MNTLVLAVIVVAIALIVLAWRTGVARGRRERRDDPPPAPSGEPPASPVQEPASRQPPVSQFDELVAERHRLLSDLADARADAARYRQIVVDLERDTPPPLLDAPNAPDDLKLIVGIGPVLERMLQQLGIFSYRQIARWSERDIDAFDSKLPEFPGRIRRDAWVTQARALQQSKYGERS